MHKIPLGLLQAICAALAIITAPVSVPHFPSFFPLVPDPVNATAFFPIVDDM
jgi:hypothetical protein